MNKKSSLLFAKILILLSVLLFVLSAYFLKWRFVEKVAFGMHDLKYSFRAETRYKPKIFKDILIVAIDEKSINEFGRWPWKRTIIADLFANLSEANIVGLDMVFSERTNEEDDNILAETIEDNENIILGFFLRDEATNVPTDDELDILDDFALNRYKSLSDVIGLKEFKYVEPNIIDIAEGALSGAFFTTESDSDGLFRRYPIAYMFDGNIFPSLGFQILRFYLNKDINLVLNDKGIKELTLGDIKIKDTNSILLNFYKDVPYISAYDVIENKLPEHYFKNKIVIVGVTEIGVYDLRPTPMNTITPGVSLHLTAVSNLLQHHFLKPMENVDLGLIIAILFIVLLISFLSNLYLRISLYSISLFGLIALSYFLFCKYNIFLKEFYPSLSLIFSSVGFELYAFIKTEAKSLEIKKAFSAYVSPEVVNIMTKEPDKLKLGGENRDISVLFADIRGFTTLSEKLSSEEIVYVLNKLNDPLTEAILKHEGLLDKYIGDAIMALFNTPIDIEHHADKICYASLEMVDILHKINIELKDEGFPEVDIGIGINSGTATVGNMGSKIRFDYTAIGDTVNLSSRLEGLNKVYRTRIIFSENTLERLHDNFLYRQLDRVRVKGKNIPINIFELMSDTNDNKQIKEKFDIGLKYYFNRNFKDAFVIFKALMEESGDLTSEVFMKRCESFIENKPDDDWDGTFNLTTK